jgi:hypothetical protein
MFLTKYASVCDLSCFSLRSGHCEKVLWSAYSGLYMYFCIMVGRDWTNDDTHLRLLLMWQFNVFAICFEI